MTNVHIYHLIRQWKKRNNCSLQHNSTIQYTIEIVTYLCLSKVHQAWFQLEFQNSIYQWSKITSSTIFNYYRCIIHISRRYENSFIPRINIFFPTSLEISRLELKDNGTKLDVFLTVEWLFQGNWQFRPRWPPSSE